MGTLSGSLSRDYYVRSLTGPRFRGLVFFITYSMQIEINNPVDPTINKIISEALSQAADYLLVAGIIPESQNVEMSVAVVDSDEIRKLNKQYRQIDQPTDVLSFQYETSPQVISGEIILCLAVIQANAEEDSVSPELELKKNVIHGLLHNLGFEHGPEMFDWQDKILSRS